MEGSLTLNIMMIDPWGVNNLSMYTNGLCDGLSEQIKLTLCTNYHFQKTTDAQYKIERVFFKRSEKMEKGKLRKGLRLFEYIFAYKKILRELKSKKYDVVHIQWLLNYKTDFYYLKKIKKHCNKVVYTAHNVIPHKNGEKYIDELSKIYDILDRIVLHGEGIKKEFLSLFGEFADKVRVQQHGTYLNQDVKYEITNIDKEICEKVKSFGRVSLFLGNIFYNKGVDRLVRIWLDEYKGDRNNLLIIAGRKTGRYPELEKLEKDMLNCANIIYIKKFIDDNLLNFFIDKSQIILMPYRHASMSGVVFTAAEFGRPVFCTNSGSLSEYLVNEENCFLVENQDTLLREKLKYVIEEVTKEKLQNMGNNLNKHIRTNFSWKSISKKLVTEVYKL